MSLPYHRPSNNNMYSRTGNTSNIYGNGVSSNSSRSSKRAEENNVTLMELENNQKWDELGDQVSLLKEISIGLNKEVKSQNQLLDGMGSTFNSTTEMFKTTIGKLGTMLTSGSSNHMYYLILFVVFIFIILYFMMRYK